MGKYGLQFWNKAGKLHRGSQVDLHPIVRSWDIIHLSAQDACRRTSQDDQGRVPDEAKTG
jgi:hypothetical protein